MTPDIPPPTTLPCGCHLHPTVVNGRNELRVSPCKPGCRYLAMMMEMANEEEVPVERRYGR